MITLYPRLESHPAAHRRRLVPARVIPLPAIRRKRPHRAGILQPHPRQRSQVHPVLGPVLGHRHRLETACCSNRVSIHAEHPGHTG